MPRDTFKPKLGTDLFKVPLFDKNNEIPEEAASRIASMAIGLSGLESPDEIKSTHERIKTEIMTTGTSGDVQQILQNQALIRSEETAQTAELIVADPLLTQDQKKELLFTTLEDAKTPISLKTAFLERFALAAEAETVQAQENQVTIASRVNDIITERRDIEKAKIMNVNFDDNTVADFLGAIALPGGFAVQTARVIADVFPDLPGAGGYILPGGIIQEMKDRLRGMEPLERRDAVLKLIDAIDKNSFYGANNGFVKWDMLNTLLDDYSDSNWERVLNDVFGVADWFAALEAIRIPGTIFKLAKRGKTYNINISRQDDKLVVTGDNETLVNAMQLELDKVVLREDPAAVSSMLAQVAPEDAKRLIDQILELGDEETARNLGTSLESLAMEFGMPKISGTRIPAVPPVDDIPARQIDSLNVIKMGITDEELDAFKTDIVERIQALSTQEDFIHLNKSSITPTEVGYTYETVIGSTQARGYNNWLTANSVANRYKERLGGTKVEADVLARDFKSGELKPFDEVELEPGQKTEYYVRLKTEQDLSINAAQDTELTLGSLGVQGKGAKFFDKNSYLQYWVSAVTNQAEAQFNVRRRGLSKFLAPITSMHRERQAKVMEAIQKGSDESRWLTDEDLYNLWKNENKPQELVDGYHAFVEFMNESHRFINEAVRNYMAGKGYKHLTINRGLAKGENEYFGSIVTKIDDNPREVWDAKLGDRRVISKKEIDEILEGGPANNEVFVRLGRPIQKDGRWIYYVLMNDRRAAKLQDLPDVVVRQLDGKIPRIYDATRVIRETAFIRMNGAQTATKVSVARHVYRNPADADAAYNKLLESEGLNPALPEDRIKSKYSLDRADELKDEALTSPDTLLEQFETSGQLFTSKLGDELKTVDGDRQIADLSSALRATQLRAARIGTVDQIGGKLLQNLNKRYSHLFVKGTDGRIKMHGSPERAKEAMDPALDQQWANAVAARDYLRMFLGIDEGTERKVTRAVMDFIGDRLATSNRSRAVQEWGYRAIRARDSKPTNLAKMVNFTRFMVLNPVRQIFLQMHQGSMYLGLEGGMKYWLGSRKGTTEYFSAILGLLSRDLPEFWPAYSKYISKRIGMSPEEYTEFIDAIRRSGIIQEIDSHQFLSGYVFGGDNLASSTRAFENALGDVKDNIEMMLGYARHVGFDAGEASQRIAGLLTVKNRWQLRNPRIANRWMEPENLAEIAGQAQVVGLNMSRAGTLEQQRNIFGMAAQFTAFAQKTLQLLIPEKALGKTVGKFATKGVISGKERRNIAIIQAAMFGTASWGVAQIVRDIAAQTGTEIPPQVLEATEQGLYGTALNMAIRMMSGEDILLDGEGLETSIDISGGVAPVSAIAAGGSYSTINNLGGRIYDTILLSDRDIVKLLAGPTTQTLRDIGGVWKYSTLIRGVDPDGFDPLLPENASKTKLIVDRFARRFIPLYNSFVRNKLEQSYGRLVNSDLEPMFEATDTEIFVRNVLGLQPRRNKELQALKNDLKRSKQVVNPIIDTKSDPYDDTAATLYFIIRSSLVARNDQKINDDELKDVLYENIHGLRKLLNDRDYSRVMSRMEVLIRTRFAQGTEEFELGDLLTRIYGRGDGDPYEEMITKIKNMPNFDGKQEYLDTLQWYMNGTDSQSNVRGPDSRN